jgi:hypothetical protein
LFAWLGIFTAIVFIRASFSEQYSFAYFLNRPLPIAITLLMAAAIWGQEYSQWLRFRQSADAGDLSSPLSQGKSQ